jgi:hypothetical protein
VSVVVPAPVSPLRLIHKTFAPGPVLLGGNLAAGAQGAGSMYTVLLLPTAELGPVALQITPTSAVLNPGGTAQFNATVTDPLGQPGGGAFQWTATGGTINGQGLYTAGNAAGSYQVIALRTEQGLADTAEVSIGGPSGSLQVSTATTGSDLDPDGYAVTIDGSGNQPIGVNDQITIPGLSAQDHTVRLNGVASNCTVSGANPRTVNVPAGGSAQTTFSVTCTASSGSAGLRIVNDHFLELDGRPWHGRGMGNYFTIADLNVDYQEMIDVYAAKGTTLMRMTVVGPPVRHSQVDPATEILYPVKRVGPGTDNVGGLKFDCTQLDMTFFNRLEAVVAHAASRGVVISLVLWDEIPLELSTYRWYRNPWNPDNNINGYGLPSLDAVPEFYDLSNPALLASQEAVVAEVLNRIHPYGNVIISIGNEYTGGYPWHQHWHNFVQTYEATNGGLPILTNEMEYAMTFSYTDLISASSNMTGTPSQSWDTTPNRPVVSYRTTNKLERPAERDAGRREQWRTFMNGSHVGDDSHDGNDPPDQHNSADSRAGADMIRVLADFVDALVDINAMVPNHVSGFLPAGPSDRVGRAWRGAEYAVYLPTGGSVSVDLSDASGAFKYEWLDPRDGRTQGPQTVQVGAIRSFTSPYSEAVLHIHPEG